MDAASPYTVSVGRATIPSWLRRSTVRRSASGSVDAKTLQSRVPTTGTLSAASRVMPSHRLVQNSLTFARFVEVER